MAYTSDESGQSELYLTSFPEGKGRWRVCPNGAEFSVWTSNGKELFFKDLNDAVWVCSITAKGEEMQVGIPQRLFHASQPATGVSFDVAPDGGRLLVNVSEDESINPLNIMTNWPALLKK